MGMTVGEKIKVLMKRRGMNMTTLAEATDQTRQNLSNKMSRDNFSEKDIELMAKALGCTVSIVFEMEDTGEKL